MSSFPSLISLKKNEEEIKDLFARYQKTRDGETREKLIIYHMDLVCSLAKKFVDRGKPLDSLISVGTIGLINAVDRYDAAKGVKFSSYATHLILGEIRRYFRDKCWGVKVSRKTRKLNRLIQQEIEEMTKELNRSPTISEIAEKIGLSNEKIIEALEAGRAYNPYSLDLVQESENGRNSCLLDYFSSTNHDLKQLNSKFDLEETIHHLPKKEQVIIRLYYFESYSQTRIAKRLGISQMHVSRLLKQALVNLKKIIKD